MEPNDVSISVREALEGMISIVETQAAKKSYKTSPLAATPRDR